MKLELTKEQEKEIALEWIRNSADYKVVLDTLFSFTTCNRSFSWVDALKYAVALCGKNFCSKKEWILKELND